LLLAITGFSGWQMYNAAATGYYPRTVSGYAEVQNASATFALQLPTSWKIDHQEDKPLSLEAVGPFRERISLLVGLNSEPVEDVLKEYVDQRTQEIESTDEINLKSRRGPEHLEKLRPGTYRIRWLISSGGGPLSVVDYLVFEDEVLYLLRFFLGTEADTAYDNLAEKAVTSFRLLQPEKR
jgi:hypothetical protein